ncbi:MAG TPA: DNA repair protein RecN [Virgibacillus sp.]|nr:DNA repair protein RecN [Virgibacillus sp.]
MLTELSIRDFAIIDKVSLTFNDGLTVLTGETGAGKSIIIDAVQLLAGGRGSVDYVRHGAKKADIEGLFTIESKDHLVHQVSAEYGIDIQDNMLVLQRTITHQGKSICRVNGKLVTLAILREFGKTLIDIHSQHETQSLMDPSNHIELLDLYDEPAIAQAKEEYTNLFHQYQLLSHKYDQLSTNEQELAHRLDLLEFQMRELEQAQLEPNEDLKLEEERSHLVNFEKIFLGVQEAYNALYGEQRGIDWLNKAQLALQDIRSFDPTLEKKAEELTNSFFIIEELSFELRQFSETLHYDKQRLNEIEGRLDEINRLKKKYGSTVNEILEYMAKIEEEIEQITNRDSHLQSIKRKMIETARDAYLEAKELHELRKNIAKKLTIDIEKELKGLYLEQATFSVSFQPFPSFESENDFKHISFHKDGLDHVQFLISTNVGEPLKAIHKVASGGELSRIMLAIKKIFAEHQGVTSVIFDEVDTGVSGRVAQAMGEKIVQISNASQVLCITHLPQVAAMADTHILITKYEKDERTSTSVKELSTDEQISELSRMMTGPKLTPTAKEYGKELLDLAITFKMNIG